MHRMQNMKYLFKKYRLPSQVANANAKPGRQIQI